MDVKTITCTVTNDLNFDQRMIRICTSLQNAGYNVILIGRKKSTSTPLIERTFKQKRLFCFSQKGKLFYIEYNIRLFFYLLFTKTHLYCAIDLDTILPNLLASIIRSKPRVYDAHELFCEMEEIVSRPTIFKIWKGIEKFAIPKFPHGYTIGECYAEEFHNLYGVQYEIVRNATVLRKLEKPSETKEKYILYQGAVNEGRSFETLIPAMLKVNCKLIICGEGNFYRQAQDLVDLHKLHHKIEFKGYVEPQLLQQYTKNATIGITLFTNQGKSNYLSMANRFFDYMHYAIPQLCVAFPEYKKVNEKFEIAYLIEKTSEQEISDALNVLLQDAALLERLQNNCLKAREIYCWQNEEAKLVSFYRKII